VRFGAFELDSGVGELRKQGVRIKLQEQPLRVLEMLLRSPGELVTREELRSVLWPTNSLVDFDHGLNRAINKLREALGDSADRPQFIETLAKRGYRFLRNPDKRLGEIRSLLVLPLENLSKDPEQGYFADGLTEALTTSLAKIGALRVLSRTTAVYCKRAQKSLADIVRELGVDGIIEGSVLRSEGRVRISVQLLHAPTDTHLWAESYERDLRNILALQAEVTSAIAREIKVKVTPQEQRQLARAPVVEPQAFDAYMRGRCYVDKRTPDATRKAIQSFEEAIHIDPQLAPAYAGLSICFNVLGWYAYVPPADGCGRAKALALRALELDPQRAEAHAALGWAVQYIDFDFATAEREFRRAIELDPHYPVARYRYAMALTYVGRFDESIEEGKRALKLEPFSATPNAAICWGYWQARRYDALLAHAKWGVELHPDVPHCRWALSHGYEGTGDFEAAIGEMRSAVAASQGATLFQALLAEVLAVAGRRADAEALLHQLQQRARQGYVSPYSMGRIHAVLGRAADALQWLETAFEQRAAWTVMLNHDPRLDSLRDEPRFQALVRQMNFPS
jgi:TolB-like protein/Flp pilus assembly protein TadD